MNLLSKIFGKKPINSTTIAAEIEKARTEHDEAIAKRGAAVAGLGTMSDAEHVQAEAEYEKHRRAADRAAARIAELEAAHADALAAEAEAERVAAEQRLRDRVEAARHAVDVEAADLLQAYDEHAAAIGDILARLDAINAETNTINETIRHRPEIEGVVGVDATHRKHPDRKAGERRETVPCWVYTIRHAENLNGKWSHHDEEVVLPATIGDDGNPVPGPSPVASTPTQTVTTPRIEMREIVTGRTDFRPGRYENSLSAIHLPPGFAKNGSAHWPRRQ